MNSIFNKKLFLGYISKINAGKTFVHIPSSTYLSKFIYYGEKYHGGLLNSYVAIEGEHLGFIGRVNSAEIPEKERIELSSEAMKYNDFHPLLEVEILSEFDYCEIKFKKSVINLPNIGSKVYIANNNLVKRYFNQLEQEEFEKNKELKTCGFAKILSPNIEIDIDFSLQKLFSRHVAVVGTTGSGKSWTTSSLVINLLKSKHKAILIDATGEYSSLAEKWSTERNKVIIGENFVLSYRN